MFICYVVKSDKKEALRIAMHCAPEAQKYEQARLHCEEYLKHWPQDDLILKVLKAFEKGIDLKNIKYYFSRSPK